MILCCTTRSQFEKAFHLAEQSSRQIYGFMRYLKSQPNMSRVREENVEYTTNG